MLAELGAMLKGAWWVFTLLVFPLVGYIGKLLKKDYDAKIDAVNEKTNKYEEDLEALIKSLDSQSNLVRNELQDLRERTTKIESKYITDKEVNKLFNTFNESLDNKLEAQFNKLVLILRDRQ